MSAQKANLKLTHIPYNGPMLGDIISGVVDVGSLTASTVMGNIDGGTLRALAVGTDTRLANYLQVPTFKELGFDISPIAWMAISGPPGMSRELQMSLHKQISDILARPKVQGDAAEGTDCADRDAARAGDRFHQRRNHDLGADRRVGRLRK